MKGEDKDKTILISLDLDEAQIQLHLSSEILREVNKETTAAGLWLKLESLLMKKSLATRLYAKSRLYSHKLSEGKSVKLHLEEFRKIVNDLESLDVKTDDEDLAMLLLYHLPPSYNNFRDTILYGKDTITLDEVCSSFFSRDKMNSELDRSTFDSHSESLVARDRDSERHFDDGGLKSSSGFKGKGRDVICNYCKKKEHIKIDYFKLKNKLDFESKKNPPKLAKTSLAIEGSVLISGQLGKSLAYSRDVWILDSGCCFHVCPHREFFATYASVDREENLLGNNAICKAAGKGTIQIRMHDDVVRTLSDVRHVPDLTKNLISLSALHAKGFRYSGAGRVLRVTRGARTVLQGKKFDTLYVL